MQPTISIIEIFGVTVGVTVGVRVAVAVAVRVGMWVGVAVGVGVGGAPAANLTTNAAVPPIRREKISGRGAASDVHRAARIECDADACIVHIATLGRLGGVRTGVQFLELTSLALNMLRG